jgi:NADH dehydrogenase FAD-containing subunit
MHYAISKKRIVILGGGFGGIATARHLEALIRWRKDVEIVLVSRDNFVLMTPLLFEVFSGTLEARDCSLPIRGFLRNTRFIQAAVESIDLDRQVMGSLGHRNGFAQFLRVRLRGFPAWFIRRTYYLLQMPGWGRRLRILADWTFALLFPPDFVRVGLDRETAKQLRDELLLCDADANDAIEQTASSQTLVGPDVGVRS